MLPGKVRYRALIDTYLIPAQLLLQAGRKSPRMELGPPENRLLRDQFTNTVMKNLGLKRIAWLTYAIHYLRPALLRGENQGLRD